MLVILLPRVPFMDIATRSQHALLSHLRPPAGNATPQKQEEKPLGEILVLSSDFLCLIKIFISYYFFDLNSLNQSFERVAIGNLD